MLSRARQGACELGLNLWVSFPLGGPQSLWGGALRAWGEGCCPWGQQCPRRPSRRVWEVGPPWELSSLGNPFFPPSGETASLFSLGVYGLEF